MNTLDWNNNSLNSSAPQFHVYPDDLNAMALIFTITNVTNLSTYLSGLDLYTVVGYYEVGNDSNPLLTGSVFLYQTTPTIQFITDAFTVGSGTSELVDYMILNFAYRDPGGELNIANAFIQNDIFGADSFNLSFPSDITFTNNGGGTFVVTYQDETISELPTDWNQTITTYADPHCLYKDTLILTDTGYRKIEDLKVGDLVLRQDQVPVEIKYLYKKTYYGDDVYGMYKIKKNAFFDDMPFQDLIISGKHEITLGNKSDTVKNLYDQKIYNIEKQPLDEYDIYHIGLEKRWNILANGIIVEPY